MKAIIEIPQGSILKYEVDKEDGTLVLDRVLNQPIPFNYGYMPGTLCGDGDPLDVFVLGNFPIQPLAKVKIELLGVLHCKDNGEEDDKLIAMVQGDEQARHMGTDIIRTYLMSYKKGFEIIAFGGPEEALKTYKNAILNELADYEERIGIIE